MSSFASSLDVDIAGGPVLFRTLGALAEGQSESTALNGRMWASKVSQTVGVVSHFCCSCKVLSYLWTGTIRPNDGPYLS